MFFCDYCRAAHAWPRSSGWPYMGVSHGKCEMCGNVEYCHDVPSGSLPMARGWSYKECTECFKRRPHLPTEYVCLFCRGTLPTPHPDAEIADSDKASRETVEKLLQEYLDKM